MCALRTLLFLEKKARSEGGSHARTLAPKEARTLVRSHARTLRFFFSCLSFVFRRIRRSYPLLIDREAKFSLFTRTVVNNTGTVDNRGKS